METISIYKASATPVIKLLLVVVLTESVIMFGLHWLNGEQSSLWGDLFDVMMLAVVTTVVAWGWILRPMQRANEQDAFFRALAQSASAGMVITDVRKDNRITYTNPAFTTITGFSSSEAKGNHPGFLNAGLGQTEEKARVAQALKNGEPVHVALKNKRKDGSLFWNDLQLSPIHDSHGKPRYWLGLLTDITEIRSLNQQVEQLAAAVEHCHDAICLFGDDGRISFANPAYLRLTVAAAGADMIGQPMTGDYVDPAMAELATTMVQQTGGWTGRHRRRRADGSEYESLTAISSMQGMDGQQVFISSHRDITEQVEQEKQAAHSMKMEAVGTLAGGVAHDFNNMLAGMLGQLYMLRRDVAMDTQAVERLDKVEALGHRGAGLIAQMLTFARNRSHVNKCFDLHALVNELEEMLRLSVPENIMLNVAIDDGPLMVEGDAAQLESSLMNLVNNARYAVESGSDGTGQIALTVRRQPLDPSALLTNGDGLYGSVVVRIEDSGCGMDEKTRQRIFEPYFTTKGLGHGTGLGLPMVAGCIDMMDGELNVYSEPGAGSCFEIILPLRQQSDQNGESKEEVALRPGTGEMILLVDDDETVRRSLQEVLETLHYTVITANNGEDGVEQFKAHADELQLVIADIVMPRMDGRRMAREIRQLSHGDLAVVLMTGYDIQDHGAATDDCALLISKPWSTARLNEALNLLSEPLLLANQR